MARTPEHLKDRQTYSQPDLACDVVMKGGITSGIAYPLAVCEIASRYKLVNVGGSSAGAIAAAAAAAAEAGRESKTGGFARLASLPERLAGDPSAPHSMLFELFQPQLAMEPYYRILVAFVATGLSKTRRLVRAAKEAARAFWRGGIAGAAFGFAAAVLLVVLNVRSPEVRGDAWSVLAVLVGIAAALTLAVVGGLAGLVIQAVRDGRASLQENMYGICSGYVTPGPGTDSACGPDQQLSTRGKCVTKPLTIWLADEIDRLAGGTPTASSAPLTLGDLCDAGVRLKVFTTNLTNGTPYTIPFKDPFYFHEDELRKLFPTRVVDWMVDHAVEVSEDTAAILAAASPKLHRLPRWDDLPVIVATRMSLSFPLLLTAVPLWQIDWREREAYRCWFSDGGITSNFPVHFFDGPVPRRPTFGLNLGPFWKGETPSDDECENIYAPTSNGASMSPRWSGIDTVGRFGRAILDTMQNWSDNAQALLPGYRDRIVLIKHTDDEGGMNLDMPHDRILRFSERGRCAGAKLVAKFSTQPPSDPDDDLSWDNHRWVRYRSTMNALETFVEGWLRGFGSEPAPSQSDYPQLIDSPPSYVWAGEQQARGRAVTALLETLATDWLRAQQGVAPDPCRRPAEGSGSEPYDPAHPFRKGAPHPRPRLRITPDF